EHIGQLATYGFVNFSGMCTLLAGVAKRLKPGVDWQEALAGCRFLDLGCGDARAVVAAAVLVRGLEAVGVELSTSRHELAVRNRSRLPRDLQEKVRLEQMDILQ
ncbi:unnamed protein product, partial [Effrenium voratum]